MFLRLPHQLKKGVIIQSSNDDHKFNLLNTIFAACLSSDLTRKNNTGKCIVNYVENNIFLLTLYSNFKYVAHIGYISPKSLFYESPFFVPNTYCIVLL